MLAAAYGLEAMATLAMSFLVGVAGCVFVFAVAMNLGALAETVRTLQRGVVRGARWLAHVIMDFMLELASYF